MSLCGGGRGRRKHRRREREGREMKRFDNAVLWRLKENGRKRVKALLLLFLLPCLISACRAPSNPPRIFENLRVQSGENPNAADAFGANKAEVAPKLSSLPDDDRKWAALDRSVPNFAPIPDTGVLLPTMLQKSAASAPEPAAEVPATLPDCAREADPHDHIFFLPEHPTDHSPIRIVATTRQLLSEPMDLTVRNAKGAKMTPGRLETWGYTPRAVSAYFQDLPPGDYDVRFTAQKGDVGAVCGTLHVGEGDAVDLAKAPTSGVWEVRRDWNPAYEDLYSAFIAKLFYVPRGGQKGWRPLHHATRDPFRNLFYGTLGLGEDDADGETHVILEPDCADAPFQLRAYFAWKMGLPFVFNRCLRRSSLTGPENLSLHSNQTNRFDGVANPVERFNAFTSVEVGWKVHAGNGRTLPSANDGDVYPVPLRVESLRPGAVFVDAGGHLLLVSQVEPQTEGSIGALYGVDAHPDRTVTHKQFSLGTFVFNPRVPTDGFKLFRPSVRDGKKLRFLSNDELAERGFFPASNEQASLTSRDAFYGGVSKLLNPTPLDPVSVLENKMDVLHTAMRERVEAVAAGVAYMNANNWREMSMPSGPEIFETSGPWETYSTPARDMRCFLAIDDVMTFPEQAVKDRAQYRVDAAMSDEALRRILEAARDEGLGERTVTYERSDKTPWKLSLRDVVSRQEAMETAYNPNDCIETRWGAADGSEEKSTCKRRAPPDQRFKMKTAERWFANRQRPDQR